jgi:uncharacterized NAD(P)/FAD-binding protein YdhS
MSTPTFDVAVIGAGFTGANLAIQLINRLPAGSSVLLVGSPGDTGRGLAYRPEEPHLLLNVRAERLSLHTDDEAHFVRWLARRCHGGLPLPQSALAQSYVSRAAYGRYVRDTLFRAIERARGRITVKLVEGAVARLRPLGDEFRIRLASGERFAALTAALCLGNPPARLPLPGDAVDPAARARVIADPWDGERMRAIPRDADVLFVGSGLTMVDQALSLDRAGHAGRMMAISRHGLLPAAQPVAPPLPIEIELPRGEASLSSLFRAIVGAARASEAAGQDWRGIFESLRPRNQAIWQGLSDAERRRFMRHLEAYWSVHRHRMAPPAAAKIDAMQAAGRLDVTPAKLVGIEAEGSRIRARIRRRGRDAVEVRSFDWIVNCTGSGRYAALMRQPLVAGLVERGIARPDRLRFGLEVDGDSRLVGRSGRAAQRLFALGPLSAGRFFEITAVAEIRAQVSEVADRLTALKLAQLFRREPPRERCAEAWEGRAL